MSSDEDLDPNPNRESAFQSPKSQLQRAESLLADPRPESIFYAALEFRYAVEGRLIAYSDFVAEKINPKRKGTWRLKDMANHINEFVPIEAPRYEVTITNIVQQKSLTYTYMPVSYAVIKIAGQVDNYLHAAGVFQTTQDKSARERLYALLREGIDKLRVILEGSMNGPIVQSPDGKMQIEVDFDANPDVRKICILGDHITVKVRHVNDTQG